MIRVAIACTAAATAVVALYGLGGTNAKDWILTGIPAWFQGIGTVGAACLAWVAYQEWRSQEAEKRKADFAEKLLRAAHVAVTELKETRRMGLLPVSHMTTDRIGLRAMMELALSPEENKLFEAAAVSAAELQSLGLLCKVYFGNEAFKCIDFVELTRKRLKFARDTIAFERREEGEKMSEQSVRRVAEALGQLGWLAAEEVVNALAISDQLSNDLDEQIGKPEDILSPYLTYRAN